MPPRAPLSAFRGFSTALSSAVLEWILMLLLFFYALCAYLVTKFSRIFKLQTPCMLCSRLDHIFGNERPSFYMDLICENHRVEISTLAIRGGDRKPADTRAMFQDYILIHASERNSNSDTCELLKGKIEGHLDDPKDNQRFDGDDSFHELYDDDFFSASYLKKDFMSLGDKSITENVTEVSIPLTKAAGHGHVHGVRRSRENTLVSPRNYPLINQAFDHFSNVRYSEVKVTSDSDSEVSLQDDNEIKSLTTEYGNSIDDSRLRNGESESVPAPKSIVSDSFLGDGIQEELIHASVSISNERVLENLIPFIPIGELHDISTFPSSSSVGACTMFKNRILTLASEGTSSPETYKSLNNKIEDNFDDTPVIQGVDSDDTLDGFHGDDLATSPFLEKDAKLHAIRSLEDKSLRSTVTDVDIPLEISSCHSHLHYKDATRETMENNPLSPKYHPLCNEDPDRFYHVVYSEVKITSDSDSEVPFQDDDEIKSPTNENENIMDDLTSYNIEAESATASKNILFSNFLDELGQEELIQSASVCISDGKAVENLITSLPIIYEPSEINSDEKINVGELFNVSSISSSSVDTCTIFKDGLYTLASERKSIPETKNSLNMKINGHSDNLENIQCVEDDDRLHDLHGDDLASAPFLKKDLKLHSIRPLQDGLIRTTVTGIDIPWSITACHSHLEPEDAMRETRENTSVSQKCHPLGNEDFDCFCHVGYTKVKLNSDSDSEVPLEDDDERKYLSNEDENVMDDAESKSGTVVNDFLSSSCCDNRVPIVLIQSSPVSISDDKAMDKLITVTSVIDGLSEPTLDEQINVGDFDRLSIFSSSSTDGHYLGDRNSNQMDIYVPPNFEFGPQEHQCYVPLGDPVVKDDLELTDAASFQTTDDDKMGDASEPCKSTCNHINSKDNYKVAVGTDGSSLEVIMEKDSSTVQEGLKSEPGQSINNHIDLSDAYKLAVGAKGILPSPKCTEITMRNGSSSIQDDLQSESDHSISNHIILDDAYKLAISTSGSLPSTRFPEVTTGIDSFEVQEDLKLLWTEMGPSPRAHGQVDETVLHNITISLSPERNDSGFESLDGSVVSEVEGETAVEKLKRQVELDRKSISLLYKELEEERSASAIAANQTMAMITRLQEEKASMQMEALQYLRMMEEQAEYDQEALQKCNELLTLREQEILDLEAELESFKKCFVDEFSFDKTVQQNGRFHDEEIACFNKSQESRRARWSRQGTLNDPLSCFEDEEAYILNSLKKLEEKLHLFSSNGICDDGSSLNGNDDNGNRVPDKLCAAVHEEDYIERNAVPPEGGLNCQNYDGVAVSGSEQHHLKDGPSENIQTGDSIILEEKIPDKGSKYVEVNHDVESSKQYLKVGSKSELVPLQNEVTYLCQRLAALEADRKFLEDAINSLRNGNDGLQFIQEIACDLHELRRICITKRDHLAA